MKRIAHDVGTAGFATATLYSQRRDIYETCTSTMRFGTESVHVSFRAWCRPRAGDSVTVGGMARVVLPPGSIVLSDPVDLAVNAGDALAVSMHFADEPVIGSFHWEGRSTSHVFQGDQLTAVDSQPIATTTVRLFLTGVLIEASSRGTIVALGDSITDGAGASLDNDTRWPDLLADRMAPHGLAVINAGISGAQLLSDGNGVNALARLDRDVLSQPGVRTMVLKIGTNDLGFPGTSFMPNAQLPTFDTMVQGYRALVARTHAAGIRVVVSTLAPFAGALPDTPFSGSYQTPHKEALRQRLNAWIRGENLFDVVVDFAKLLADPDAPDRLGPQYDCGDRLHPNDNGNRAMAASLGLETLMGNMT